MSLSKRQIAYLNKIVSTAQKMLATADLDQGSSKSASSRGGSKRRRRSGAEAEKMRADILAKRSKGVPAEGEYGRFQACGESHGCDPFHG